MRSRILLTSLLLLSLSASGWSSVMAAVFCAHDGEGSATTVTEHDCCRVKSDAAQEHCEAAATHQSSHEEVVKDKTEAPPAVTAHADALTAVADEATAAPCLHCVSRGGLPVQLVVKREAEQKKRGALETAPPAIRLRPTHVTAFITPHHFKRGAPPGLATHRHLLLSTFLI